MTGNLIVSDSTIAISDGTTNRLVFSRETSPAVQTKIESNNYHLTLQASGTSQGQIRFNTGTTTATEKMRILEGGNVGIGTTSPADKLSVAGYISTTNGAGVQIGGATGDTKIGKLYNVSGVLSIDGEGNRNQD